MPTVAPSPSSVDVDGPAHGFAKLRVEVAVKARARAGGVREIFRQQAPLWGLDARGRRSVAFLLRDIGCEPLDISTALLGQTDPARRAAQLPFHCGE